MVPRSLTILTLVIIMTLAGCHSATPDETLDTTLAEDAKQPQIESSIISADQLPSTFDRARTFHYRVGRVEDPQRLLLDLWDSGIRSRRAWQPLDNRCFDPIGPQFTVELLRNDARILEHGFERGNGRLHCATTLTRYKVRKPGG